MYDPMHTTQVTKEQPYSGLPIETLYRHCWDRPTIFPSGLIGDIAYFIYCSAPHPNANIALAAALAFMAGIAGRSYSVNGAGLNLYILILARTGAGKSAAKRGIDKLIAAILAQIPAVANFRGPGELPSGAGLLKFFAKLDFPVALSIIGEFPKMLAAMGPNNPNGMLLKRAMLDFYDKSGPGGGIDPAAYADAEKRTGFIKRPSWTVCAEGTAEVFFANQSDDSVADGFLPRWNIFIDDSPRPYENESPLGAPWPALAEAVKDFVAAACEQMAGLDNPRIVGIAPDAADELRKYSRWTTDKVNDPSAALSSRELWNRAYLKILKVAALLAVARNPRDPTLQLEDAVWAGWLIYGQTMALVAKFEKGEIGEVAGNQSKQETAVLEVIKRYYITPYDKRYPGTAEMHDAKVIAGAYIAQKLYPTAAFKNDRRGAKVALKQTIESLMDADYIRRIPQKQMADDFGTQMVAYIGSNADRIFGEI